MAMLYMGVGGDWSPDCPLIDILISQRLQARGFVGTRDEKICLYGSTIKEQALDYARDGAETHLKVLEPQVGCVISWVPTMKDMLLNFGTHLHDLRYDDTPQYRGVKFGALVRDIAGDLDIAETYLRLGRQKRAIGAMIDSFLEPLEIREQCLDHDIDIEALLEFHQGEVWITGRCLVHDFDPLLHSPRQLEMASPSMRP
jgi:hypothetical protein